MNYAIIHGCMNIKHAGIRPSQLAFIQYVTLFGHWKYFLRPEMFLLTCFLLGRQS